MIQLLKFRDRPSKARIIVALAIITAVLLTGVVYAQIGGIKFSTKAGDPTELVADGNSQTRLMIDLYGCSWYPTAGADDLIQIEFTSSLGTSISPPSVNKTIGEVISPYELTLKAGSQYGTAKVTASATFCSEDNTMVFGICSSQEEQNNPKCTGEIEIPIRPAGASEEGEESPEESEETGDLSVSISCTPNPKKGASVSCTASVSGANQNESLEYLWSLEGSAGSITKNSTFSWKGEETGYYEVSVKVFGKDRDAIKTLLVDVLDSESSGEEEETEDSISSGTSEVSNLVSSLESFLKSAGLSDISPARLAVAGTGVSALIAIWMITQHRSGIPMEKLEQALGKWRWREGQKVPKPQSEVEKKAPEEPPKRLPEAEKIDKGAKPPSSLPEEKGVDKGAQASASAQLDPIPDTAAAHPSTAKAASGETVEQRLKRLVDDTEGYREAVDKTISEVEKIFERVPKEIKESELWKQKVAPKLKKLDDLGIKSKSGKLKEFLRIAKELLEVRRKIDARLSYLPEKDRQGVIWLTRLLQAGQEGLQKIHQQLITDPAIAAFKSFLPKEQAAAVEKILKQRQADIGKVLKGIKDIPAQIVDKGMRASQRNQNVGIVKKMTNKVWQSKGYKDKYKFNIMKSPNKLKPAIKKVEGAASGFKKFIGKLYIGWKDTKPRKE